MKVLYFHQHFSTPAGATGNRSYWMARQLVERGHHVTMVCGSYGLGSTGLTGRFRRGRRQGVVDGIEIIEFELAYSNEDQLLRRSVTFFKFALRSTAIALSRDYDVVFATSTPLTAGIPGIIARWLRRKRFVFEVRDLWPELPREMGVIKNPLVLRLMELLEYGSYHSAHRLIGLAPGIVEGIVRRGVGKEVVAEISNGCDLQVFREGSKPWRPAPIAPVDLFVVYSGTHGLANGLDAVLDAAVELKRRNRADIKFLLVGEGMAKKGLQARALAEGLDTVLFHDPLGKSDLVRLLAGADLGLQILANVPAFSYGTSPNKFFDYLAAGLPVLTNYPGWVADLVTRNDCGYAVPPDNPLAFADALEQASREGSLLKQKGQNAVALAERQFDRKVLGGRFVEWLERAVVT